MTIEEHVLSTAEGWQVKSRASRLSPVTRHPSLLPALDIGLAVLAAAIWYVRPQEGAWPLTLIGAAWLLRLTLYGSLTRTTPFDFPLIVFLITAFVAASIAYNQDARWLGGATPLMWAWAKYWYIVAAVALFYAVANLRGVRQTWSFARVFVLLAVAVTIYFIATNDWQVRASKFDWLTQLGALLSEPLPDVPGRRLHPNVVGGINAMILPFCVPLLVAARRRGGELVVWGLVALVAAVGLVLTGSRGAWLALAVVALGWALAREVGSFRQHRTRVRALLLTVTLFSVLVVIASMADLGTIGGTTSVGATGVPGTSTVISRFSVWQGAGALGQDYLFTGAGLGAIPLLFSAYYALVPVLFIAHGHNLFLDLLVEQGVFGLLAFVCLLVTLVLVAVRDWRTITQAPLSDEQATTRTRWLLEAALASAAVVVVHGIVDDAMYGSRALVLLFVPAAIVAALHAQLPKWNVRLPWRVVAVALALVALAALWQRDTLLGMWYANRGALTQAQIELGQYHSPDRLPEQVRRESNLDVATAQLTRALQFDAGNRTANQRLGQIALARGRYDAARDYLEAAFQRDPTNETTWQLLGDAYLALGRIEDAHALWARVTDAPSKLSLEVDIRYGPSGDAVRAQRATELAARIRAERAGGQ